MIPQKAIKKFTKDAHREIVVGHLLAYGFFPQTSDGIDKAKKFAAGLDQWIAPSDLPNYYDGLESDLMTGKETAGIRNIRMILDEFYFGGEESKPEEIPVEIEVVEVEQKTVDEPIVVTIEAPFEPAPERKRQAPKRIRLPRRSGTIPARPIGPPKKTVAERMADAFDERLDDLIDTVQNPPPPEPPKQRMRKESLAKIKRAVKPKSSFKEEKKPKPFENLTAFTGLKIKSAFSRAADARRMAKEQGLPEQEKGFYVKKALGFEFGGDAIARTRGTFSRSPDATLDPSLSKQQRYTEGLFGTRTIRAPKKVTTSAGSNSESFKDLENSFDKLTKKFDEVINLKKDTPQSDREVDEFNKVVNELKQALNKGNKLQKEINASKKEQAKNFADAANDAEAAAKEAAMEKGQDLSTFESLDTLEEQAARNGGGDQPDGKGDGFNLGDIFDKIKNFKAGKWLRRLKNPGKFLRSIGRLNRMRAARFLRPAGNVLRGATQLGARVGQGVQGLVSGGAATTAAIVGGVGLAASGIGEGLFQLTKKGGAGEQTRDALKKKGEEIGGPLGSLIGGVGNLAGFSTEATKVTGNALDAIGAPFRYAIEGIRYPFLNEEDRQKQADNLAKFDARIREYSRGWMNRIDFMNVVPDEKGGFGNIYGNNEAQKDMMEKMSEGGTIPEPTFQGVNGPRMAEGESTGSVKAMVGEAGPEMVMGPGSEGGVNPLQSLAPIIVAMREVTKRAGTWADPIENMVRQITDPIAKQLSLPVVPMKMEIGQGSGSGGKKPDDTPKNTGGGFGDIMEALSKLVGGGPAAAAETGNAIPVSAGAKGVLDLIASVESNGSYDVFNTSRGGTPGKATEKTIQWLADNAQGAIGRYQHMPEFILARAQAAGFGPNTLFTPDVQDAITVKMLETSHGLQDFLSGKMSAETFAAKLAPTWRGLPQGPDAAGKLGGTADSTYNDRYASGNAAHMKWADTVATLRTIKPSAAPATGGPAPGDEKKDFGAGGGKNPDKATPIKATMKPQRPNNVSTPAPRDLPEMSGMSPQMSIVPMPLPSSGGGEVVVLESMPESRAANSMEQLRRMRLAQ